MCFSAFAGECCRTFGKPLWCKDPIFRSVDLDIRKIGRPQHFVRDESEIGDASLENAKSSHKELTCCPKMIPRESRDFRKISLKEISNEKEPFYRRANHCHFERNRIQSKDSGSVQPRAWGIYKWKQKYGGLEVNEAKRLRELEQENSKLKRMVANLMLEKEAIEEALYAAVGE